MRADLLLVNGDPTKSITATRNIEAVWVNGVKVDPEANKAKVPTMKEPPRMGPPPRATPPAKRSE